MNRQGYYRHPTICKDTIAFVCADDIWSVSVGGGVARRLTAGAGECTMPRFSPDGQLIAFVGREEGHQEVYVIHSAGGEAKRLTYLGSDTCIVCGWTPDGKDVLFTTDAGTPFLRHTEAFAVSSNGGTPRALQLGQVKTLSVRDSKQIAIGRNSVDPAMWKRYRGGTAGEIWVKGHKDQYGATFKRILTMPGNHVWPMWLGSRIFFLSDFEGLGNLYSCKTDGSDLHRQTDHDDYYVRYPSTDGKRIVYTAGADIFIYDSQTDRSTRLNIDCPANTSQSSRRFISARDALEHIALHPQGHSLALIARGQPATMPLWEEAPIQHGAGSKVRYRLCQWLPDGKRFVVVSDSSGSEQIELHYGDQSKEPAVLPTGDIGRVIEMVPSPAGNMVALSNHRYELVLVNLTTKRTKLLDRSSADRITGLAWSADGRWLAYSWAPFYNSSKIRITEAATGKIHDVTDGLRYDWQPCFDPEGKYLYFLSARDFFPVYDNLKFDLSFMEAMRPYLVTLRNDIQSPFKDKVRPLFKQPDSSGDEQPASKRTESGKKTTKAARSLAKPVSEKPAHNKAKQVEIDFDGIAGRILSFPVEPGRYGQIVAAKGRVLFTKFPVKGIRPNAAWWKDDSELGSLWAYDFAENRAATAGRDVSRITIAGDLRTLAYSSRDSACRVIDALEKLPDNGAPAAPTGGPGRKSGWIDLNRVKILVEPCDEWAQMLKEAWRLQREHFWDERMSNVDWNLVWRRYAALLPRIHTRSELSDLIWEMQGELGTSHAYEMLGDYRRSPAYNRGFLGADLTWDKASGGWRIEEILRGDSWEADTDSPLASPGTGITAGDIIVAVGGHKVSLECSVEELLLHTAGSEVVLTVKSKGGKQHSVAVKTLRDERPLRYRRWVEANRTYVHKCSGGKIGYLHIPDMGPFGFAEFHRGYLAEFHHEALIVDVRYNRGGHVSPLLLEKLLRRRVGYDVSRWGIPQPYPPESVAGPIVGITNQFAGSDGDIFSHCFKLYKLGPLVGKRTWGGVIGIWPRHRLVDGTITTQPEFSFWFTDVGWQVENYGTDPDIEVDITPQDYRNSHDPQLEKALELASKALAKSPPKLPNFKQRPSLKLPAVTKTKR